MVNFVFLGLHTILALIILIAASPGYLPMDPISGGDVSNTRDTIDAVNNPGYFELVEISQP